MDVAGMFPSVLSSRILAAAQQRDNHAALAATCPLWSDPEKEKDLAEFIS
jgi:hypothetical protein